MLPSVTKEEYLSQLLRPKEDPGAVALDQGYALSYFSIVLN